MLDVLVGLTRHIVNHVLEILFTASTNDILLRHSMQHHDILREENFSLGSVVWDASQGFDDALSFAQVAGGVICMNVFRTQCLEYEVVQCRIRLFTVRF